MKAVQLHDIYTEEVIGTVLLHPGVEYDQVCKLWDEYQANYNSNLENEPDIYDFVSKYNYGYIEVLDLDFYQP
jgi:hypothetical protein